MGRTMSRSEELCHLVVNTFDFRWIGPLMFTPSEVAGNMCPRQTKARVTANNSNDIPTNEITK